MRYYLFTSKSKVSEIEEYPAVVLRRDSWDDFGYKTTLELMYYPSQKEGGQAIGHAKIMHDGDAEGYTDFKEHQFNELSEHYCCLGQTSEYYKNIKRLNLECMLEDLNDCAVSDTIRGKFSSLVGFSTSLLRSSMAEKLLNEAKVIFSSQVTVPQKKEDDFSFKYNVQLLNSRESTEMSFNFAREEILPFRINVLVGKNACGKSQVLSNLALTLSGMGIENKGEITKHDHSSLFGDVHVISYSPFDTFKDLSQLNGGKVSKTNISSGLIPYKFYGIRKLVNIDGKQEVVLKSHKETKKELNKSYNEILKNNQLDFISEIFETCLGWKVVTGDPKKVIDNYDNFSSGQKILVKTITDFLSSVKKDDLVLIDEPETYLHPQGVSNFYHCIKKLLDYTKSYCIMATHSPIIIQETPSKFINIMTEVGTNIRVKKPNSETLGQGFSSIISEIFKIDFDDLSFFDTLEEFKKKGVTLDKLELILGNKLDFSAKSYFMSLNGPNNEE
ncbi:AAA family ATPase [Pseudoalteromonas sp. TAB23]|uniref:AAA family ATPase n=1 Tax=Pseudoalteromonas sp. TAB23 TaxID=1938595 RepID=UPI000401E312|nr:AAA family ATPase [Pseudoalteromonas sp. TAB23]